MKKTHILSLFLALALLIGFVAVGMAPQAKAEEQPHKHCICGGLGSVGDHTTCTDVEWTAWTDATKLPTGNGYYYLDTDVVNPAVPANNSKTYESGVNNNLYLCLNGHTISSAATVRPYTVRGNMTICDCSAEQTGKIISTVSDTAAGTTVSAGLFYIYNNNSSQTFAHGMTLFGGTLTASDDAIIGGPLIRVGNGTNSVAFFKMYGGTITGAKTNNTTGSAVCAEKNEYSEFYMYGGAITGNTYKGTGTNNGAVKVTARSKAVISGSAKIADNGTRNLYLMADAVLNVNDLADDAKISVYVPADGEFGSYTGEIPYRTIVSDTTAKDIVAADGKLSRVVHAHCICGEVGAVGDHTCEEHTWTAWTKTTTLPTTSGYYVLNNDVKITGEQIIKSTEDVHLCLNGYTVNSSVRTLKVYGKLSICDHKVNGEYKGKFNLTAGTVYGALAYVYNVDSDKITPIEGTLSIFGGVFECNAANSTNASGTLYQGDLIYLGVEGPSTHATANLYDGVLSGGNAKDATTRGGNVVLSNGSVFNMYGGTITGGRASKSGGGNVYVNAGCTFNMKGGVIENGVADAGINGGNIYTKGTFNMDGGTISGGQVSAGANGGNVYVGGGTFTMNGGEIKDGVATTVKVDGAWKSASGGNMAVAAGTVKLNSGKLTGGTGSAGGNLNMTTDATCTVGAVELSGGNAVKYDTSSGGNGGNVYISGTAAGKIKFNGTTITNGTARAGGNVAAFGVVEMTDCTIDNGTAESTGNIFIYNNGKLTLNNCTVENGTTTTGNGGNIGITNDALQATTLVVNGGKIGKGTVPAGKSGTGINLGFGNVTLKGSLTMDSGNQDIYIDNAAVINYRYQTLDVSGLDTADTFTVYATINGAFAAGTDAQTKNFVTGKTENADKYACTCVDGVMYLSMADSAQIKDSKNAVVAGYYSVAEAAKHLAADQYIFMQYETIENLTADKDLYLDINGKNVRGKYDMGGNTLYGMDSTTDKYVSNTKSYFYADVENGTVASVMKAPNAKRYLNTSELRGTAPAAGKKDTSCTRRSFDRFYVGVSSVTMNPYSGEVGFKGIVGGGENVKKALAAENAFGFKVWVDGGAPETTALPQADFVTGSAGNPKNLTVKNQLEAVNEDPTLANVKVHAQVFITLADGTEIDSFEYAYSIVDMFQLVDGSFAQMDKAAQASLVRLFKQYEVMKDWSLTNIAAAA